MQGSPWSPKTPSGNLVLIFSLMFALIIYNAYAAFIISVLSVHAAPIKGLQDLLDSDFDFGYTLGGQDDELPQVNCSNACQQTVNDTILRRLYFRGLVHSHGVQQASVGLHRASQGDYAFFISSRTARRALGSFIAHDKRCDIVELTVEATKSSVALPMSWTSPYRRVINLSLLRMRESGALSLVQNQMLAPMPYCQVYSTFNSARLSDVYSAFLLLGIGLLVGLVGGVAEATWSRHREPSLGHCGVVQLEPSSSYGGVVQLEPSLVQGGVDQLEPSSGHGGVVQLEPSLVQGGMVQLEPSLVHGGMVQLEPSLWFN
ncbi:unnamed protein product [Timema podura]|uniref:Ionotropic glutamate receptor C-terminal domain-containing protein n=1 Tax=Timema podura TaxID=61482 RepID=A0ABN7PLT0_TIMPD|nr:unnamed protein product [Timema podura]